MEGFLFHTIIDTNGYYFTANCIVYNLPVFYCLIRIIFDL